MTVQEAIERFEYIKANAMHQKDAGVSEYWQQEIDATIEAIDMAIEALADRKTEPNCSEIPNNFDKDIKIDGHKLIMSLNDWWYSSFGYEETEESKAIKTVIDKVEKYVEQAEPQTGRSSE